MHNWLRRNVFHNSKSVFMWLSICGFGMIIDTHPLLSEALGSCHPKLDLSWTWFRTDENTLKLSTLRHTTVLNQVQDDGICKRLTWKRMYILWHNVIQQHCGWAGLIFITHPFMNLELRNEVLRKPIMNCFIVKAPSSNPSSRYSSSETWFGNQMRTPSSYQRCGIRLSWIKFRMTDQVRDDKYRAPHLKEDVSITHCSLCIVHYALWNEVRRKPIMNC